MFLLKLLGRKKEPWPDFAALPNPGKRPVIECVGTSAVGKSTVVRKFLSTLGGDIKLHPPQIIHTHRMPPLLSLGELTQAHTALWEDSDGEEDTQSGTAPPSARLAHIRYLIRADNRLRRSVDPVPVLLDEGIMHNCARTIMKLHARSPALARELLRNRRVIHCVTTVDRLLANLHSRHKGPAAHYKSATQLETCLRGYADYAAFLARIGVPVLMLQTHEDQWQTDKKIRAFLLGNLFKDTELP
jgi:hypothetical protein